MFVLLQSRWPFLLDVIADGTQPLDGSEAVEVIECRLKVNLAWPPKANMMIFLFFLFWQANKPMKKPSSKHLLPRPIKPQDHLSLGLVYCHRAQKVFKGAL